MAIGDLIKKKRMQIGMSQIDLATKIHVSKQTLYKYENNLVTNIPSDKIEAIANVFEVSPAFLMGWKEPAPSSADILADIAMDPQLLEYVMKIKEMTEAQKNEVYSYIDYICHKTK